jgi:exopolysaccharide production protein ExoY
MNARLYIARSHAVKHLGAATAAALIPNLMHWAQRIAALALLVLISPILLLIAALIFYYDGAPILFGHLRVGRGGRLFKCLKFRSMYRQSDAMLEELLRTNPEARAEWERDQKLVDDPRVTPIGNFLRRTSLDELPQLINVLRGEMAFVGPRPVTVAELERYGQVRWHYLSVTPGVTGLWQVSGRNNLSYAERVALDRRYVEERSAGMGLNILVKTVDVVLRGHGAR